MYGKGVIYIDNAIHLVFDLSRFTSVQAYIDYDEKIDMFKIDLHLSSNDMILLEYNTKEKQSKVMEAIYKLIEEPL